MQLIDQILELVDKHKFEHFYLIQNVIKTIDSGIEINAKWLKKDNNGWILGFCANGNYNIYGINYTSELLDEVIKELDLSVLPDNQFFSGKKELLFHLFSKNPEFQYEVLKNRLFYEINTIQLIPMNGVTEIRKACIEDSHTLAEYHCKFFEEEYHGENNKDINDMTNYVINLIQNDRIILSVESEKISGFCTRMHTALGQEMIGTVFVENRIRNNSLGKSLLYSMTNDILSRQSKCWLMTDESNSAANRMVEKIGYSRIFEYTSGFLKKRY